jgi:hypothetical protein
MLPQKNFTLGSTGGQEVLRVRPTRAAATLPHLLQPLEMMVVVKPAQQAGSCSQRLTNEPG